MAEQLVVNVFANLDDNASGGLNKLQGEIRETGDEGERTSGAFGKLGGAAKGAFGILAGGAAIFAGLAAGAVAATFAYAAQADELSKLIVRGRDSER